MEVVRPLVDEEGVPDHEVVEARRVVAEVHAIGVPLGDEGDERLDALGVWVEVLDAETITSQACSGVGDRAQVGEVVAVAGVCDHDPPGIDSRVRQRLECD